MTTRIRIAAALAAISFAAASAPVFAVANDPVTAAPAAKDPEQRVCVMAKPKGAIKYKKECRTRGEWIAATGADPTAKK